MDGFPRPVWAAFVCGLLGSRVIVLKLPTLTSRSSIVSRESKLAAYMTLEAQALNPDPKYRQPKLRVRK